MNVRPLYAIAFAFLAVSLMAGPADESSTASEPDTAPAPASATGEAVKVTDWETPGSDVEIEVRVILAGTSGIGASFPRDLFDMRSILRDRFKQYRSFRTINTIWVSSWAGETASTLVFPGHVLSVDVAAVNARSSQAKVTVNLEMDRMAFLSESSEFIRSGDIAIGQKQERHGREEIEPLSLLRSSMTVGPSEWRVIGGTQVRVSGDMRDITADPKRGGTSLSAGGVRSNRDDDALIRYIIIGLRTHDKR